MLVHLRQLSRSFRRSPLTASVAIVTLALALGTGATIFAVVDAVLLTPPPFANPDALVTIGETPIDEPEARPRVVPFATFQAWRERAGSLASLEAFDGTNLTLTDLGAAERVSATDATPGLLALLGVVPVRGRLFDRDDVGQPIAIISTAFWRARLRSDPAVIGRQIVLGGRPHTIVGVLPDHFSFALNQTDVWRPLPLTPAQAARAGYRVRAIARLASNVSPAELSDALADVSRASLPPSRVVATAVATAITGNASRTLELLAGAAGLATIVAFINLAGLLMVRAIDRRRELAVRSALGAPRSEVARQLLLEAVALVVIGTLAGVLLAFWMTPAAGRLALKQFGSIANREVAVSWRVIGLVAASAIACACISGLLPAVTASESVVDALRRGSTAPPRELTVRRLFVIGEVALAFVLLVSMSLLGRTLFNMLSLNPGFDARGVLTLQVSLPGAIYTGPERVASFYSSLQSSLQDRLGARAVSIVDEIPLTGDRGRLFVRVRPADVGQEAVVRTVGQGYFEVMRIFVSAGRAFDAADNAAAPLRVVLSRSLAERLFAFEQPVGQRIRLGAEGQFADIIGVAGEVKHRALDEAILPTIYLSSSQVPSPSSIIVVRSTRGDADVTATVREAVAQLDPNLPVYRVRTMQDVVAGSPGVPAQRLLTAAFTSFALLAIALCTLGLFGVATHEVACRRAELALRIAVGADPMRLLKSSLWQATLMVGPGLALGSVLSSWATRVLSGVVFTTDRLDPPSIAVAVTLLTVTGAAAVLPAAVRAARTDPLIALRSE
jgi:putative ABC transport system permease protein